MSAGLSGILLLTKGDVKRIKLRELKDTTPLTTDSLQTIIKKKTPIKQLHTFDWKEYSLTFFGYTSGKSGTENKHELPPPLDEIQLFSDCLIIASKKGSTWYNPVAFTPDQYESFYQSIFDNTNDDKSESESTDEESDSDTEDNEEEEKEIEEEHTMTTKKKAATEDGVPEDEDNGETSDLDEEEEDEEDDEDGGEDDEEDPKLEGDGDDEFDQVTPVPKKKSSKKKPTKQNLTVTQNTGRARQQTLLSRPNFSELQTVSDIPDDDSNEARYRSHIYTYIQTHLGSEFTSEECRKIEIMIVQNAISDAKSKFVVKHFDNSLFQVCYMNAARRLLSNLRQNTYVNNKSLLTKIKDGRITIDDLATMTGVDYYPELYTDLRNRMALREQHLLEGNKAMATDMFKCGQCHKRETTYYELQTRSADEPMTKFINCLNCGHRWRQ